jgi:hypothetical protein
VKTLWSKSKSVIEVITQGVADTDNNHPITFLGFCCGCLFCVDIRSCARDFAVEAVWWMRSQEYLYCLVSSLLRRAGLAAGEDDERWQTCQQLQGSMDQMSRMHEAMLFSTVAGLSTGLGGLIVLFFRQDVDVGVIAGMLGTAASAMITVSFVDLFWNVAIVIG